jgi:hypothetical protein
MTARDVIVMTMLWSRNSKLYQAMQATKGCPVQGLHEGMPNSRLG